MLIDLQPRLLQWARQRARLSEEALAEKMGVKVEKIEEWEQTGSLTFKQAEKLAKVTHTPFGYLFLPEPPDERLAIPHLPDAAQAALEDLEEKVDDAMERLREYRAALIPGRIDIRTQNATL
jgi:transcriptional regulator with XRE-family HTH domain